MIYLDNAATTFPKPESVYDVMDTTNRSLSVNAGRGSYKAAREAMSIIDDTKDMLQKLFHAKDGYSIALTPSITHALNQVLKGMDLADSDVVYISPYEHNAVARTVNLIKMQHDITVRYLPVRPDGTIDTDKVRFDFAVDKPSLVVMTAISNVTGYKLPFTEVFQCAKESNKSCITVLDAAQAAGLIDIDMPRSSIDIVAFAGHKTLLGPFGVGGFAIRNGIDLNITLTGGTGSDSLNLNMPISAPAKYEASSPNIVAIAGLREALTVLDVSDHYRKISELTEYLISSLEGVDKARILGKTDNCIGTVSFVVDGYASDDVGTILDEEFDIAVRTGYHCAPKIHEIINDKAYAGTIRASVGIFNTKADIDALVTALETL